MHFALSEEQQALQEAARAFLAELPGPLSMTESTDAYDAAAWQRVVDEQGWTAIVLPEDVGGWGFGLLEFAVVMEEVGRALTPLPLFATTALAGLAIARCGAAEAHARWLPALLEGQTGTLAHGGAVTARPDGSRWRLSGRVPHVIDGHTAHVVVVQADAGLFVVPGEGLSATRQAALDPSRPLATLTFDDVVVDEADRLSADALPAVLHAARILLAAENVGIAENCLQTAVAYAKVREQFGRPIGSFQALQHKLADVCVAVESARAATWYAAFATDQDAPDARLAGLTAAALAGDAAFRAAGDSIQVHGGIGFSWEHPAHVAFKRARANRALLGEPRDHRAAVADALLGGG